MVEAKARVISVCIPADGFCKDLSGYVIIFMSGIVNDKRDSCDALERTLTLQRVCYKSGKLLSLYQDSLIFLKHYTLQG